MAVVSTNNQISQTNKPFIVSDKQTNLQVPSNKQTAFLVYVCDTCLICQVDGHVTEFWLDSEKFPHITPAFINFNCCIDPFQPYLTRRPASAPITRDLPALLALFGRSPHSSGPKSMDFRTTKKSGFSMTITSQKSTIPNHASNGLKLARIYTRNITA